MSCQVVTQAVIFQKFIQLWSCGLKHMVQWNETNIVVVVDTYKVDCWISHPYFDMSFISACNHLAIKLLQLPVMSSWTVLTVYIPSVLTIVCVLHIVPLHNLYWPMGLLLFVFIELITFYPLHLVSANTNLYFTVNWALKVQFLMFLLMCSEKASLAVTLVNADNDVMGHAAFFDYPNLPSVDPSKWEEWLHSKYDCNKCNVSLP